MLDDLLSNRNVLGRLARVPFKWLPRGMVLPVVLGPLRGSKWVVGTGPHGCWLGLYERTKQRRFVQFVKPGDCVLDVGANAGFFTLLASRLVGPGGRVYSFEPLPANLLLLERHLRLNRVKNVTVMGNAVSVKEGAAQFAREAHGAMGHLDAAGDLQVRTVSLDGLWDQGLVAAPHLIKIDVEGAEARVLRGAVKLLSHGRPIVLLSAHGHAQLDECRGILRAQGYEFVLDRDGRDDGMYECVAVPGALKTQSPPTV